MDTKNALYAAVGAPIAVARTVNSRLESLRDEIGSRSGDFSEIAQKRLDEWAAEGRQVVTRVSDGKVVDELTSKVDFDQAREQVTKLRDQLEDMLATWRTSFRPVEETAGRAIRSTASAAEAAAAKADETAEKVEASGKGTHPDTGQPAQKAPANASTKTGSKGGPKTGSKSGSKGGSKSGSKGGSKSASKKATPQAS